MPKEVMRTHVILPKKLVDSVDDLVGRRCRSKFFAEAVEEKLSRLRLTTAASRAAGSLSDVDIPGWETRESAAEWVRSSREADENRLTRIREEQ